MRLEPVANPTLARTLGLPAPAMGATVVLAGILALIAGADPFSVLGLIVKGAVGSKFALLEALNRAMALIFTGLAVAVAFRARLWNIGTKAQLYAGALIAVLMGTGAIPLPQPLLLLTIGVVTLWRWLRGRWFCGDRHC